MSEAEKETSRKRPGSVPFIDPDLSCIPVRESGDELCTVSLLKLPQKALGLKIRYALDRGFYIHDMSADGLAAACGRLSINDELVAINGVMVRTCSLGEVVSALQAATSLTLQVAKHKAPPSGPFLSSSGSGMLLRRIQDTNLACPAQLQEGGPLAAPSTVPIFFPTAAEISPIIFEGEQNGHSIAPLHTDACPTAAVLSVAPLKSAVFQNASISRSIPDSRSSSADSLCTVSLASFPKKAYSAASITSASSSGREMTGGNKSHEEPVQTEVPMLFPQSQSCTHGGSAAGLLSHANLAAMNDSFRLIETKGNKVCKLHGGTTCTLLRTQSKPVSSLQEGPSPPSLSSSSSSLLASSFPSMQPQTTSPSNALSWGRAHSEGSTLCTAAKAPFPPVQSNLLLVPRLFHMKRVNGSFGIVLKSDAPSQMVYIKSISPVSNAAHFLSPGDLVLEFDGIEMTGASKHVIQAAMKGRETVTLTVARRVDARKMHWDFIAKELGAAHADQTQGDHGRMCAASACGCEGALMQANNFSPNDSCISLSAHSSAFAFNLGSTELTSNTDLSGEATGSHILPAESELVSSAQMGDKREKTVKLHREVFVTSTPSLSQSLSSLPKPLLVPPTSITHARPHSCTVDFPHSAISGLTYNVPADSRNEREQQTISRDSGGSMPSLGPNKLVELMSSAIAMMAPNRTTDEHIAMIQRSQGASSDRVGQPSSWDGSNIVPKEPVFRKSGSNETLSIAQPILSDSAGAALMSIALPPNPGSHSPPAVPSHSHCLAHLQPRLVSLTANEPAKGLALQAGDVILSILVNGQPRPSLRDQDLHLAQQAGQNVHLVVIQPE